MTGGLPRRYLPPMSRMARRHLKLMTLALCVALGIPGAGPALSAPQEPPPATQETPPPPAPRLTVPLVFELLRQNMPPQALVERIQKEGGDFDLTLEDVVRLREAGGSPELIRLMAAGASLGEVVEKQPFQPA